MNAYEMQYRQLLAKGYAAWTGEDFLRAKAQQEKIFHWLSFNSYLPPPGSPVLEMGCGNGAMASQSLAERGYSVWGVDFSETAIRWAENNFRQSGLNAHFIVGNVCHIGSFEDGKFEFIIDGSCLHCLIDDERNHFFAEVKRLLILGGRFVISSMCGSPRLANDMTAYDPVRYHLLKDGKPWRTLKPLGHLINELQAEHFNVLATRVNNNAWWDHATIVCTVNGSPESS